MPWLEFKGTRVLSVGMDKMTPGEADAVERVTGLTFQRIDRMARKCVCDHLAQCHAHRDEAGELLEDDMSCTECGDCPEFEPDMPAIVSTALTWVAIKRAIPTTKFSEVNETPYSEMSAGLDDEKAEGEPDPTEPPQEAA